MENRVKSIFGSYAEQLQVLVNTNLDAFKVPVWKKFFTLGNPQMGLTYATAVGKSRIEAAASVVEHGSEAPLRSRAAADRYTGEVAAIKVKRKMDEQEYRNYLTMQAVSTNDEAKKQQIIRLIWDDVSYVVNSVNARIDYMVGQALSTGKVKLDIDTNPDGIVPGEIDLLVSHNQTGKAAFAVNSANMAWSDANAATALPLTNIRYAVRNHWKKYGTVFAKILMTPEMLWVLLNNKQVQEHLKGSLGIVAGQDALFSQANLNAYLAAQGLPVIELFDAKGAVEKDGKIVPVDLWADSKYVTFVPAGDVGVIHNAVPIEQIAPVAGVQYASTDNILVSKWSQTEPFGEFTRGEISAFPGLEVADQMLIVDTSVAN